MNQEEVETHFADIFQLDEIVESVLKNLAARDLQRVAVVNSKWNHIVKKIKKRRQQIAWCLYEEGNGEVGDQIGNHLEVLSSEPHFAMVFCSEALYNSTVPVTTKSANNLRRSRAVKKEKIKFKDYMERILPKSCNVVGVSTDGIVGTSFDSTQIAELESNSSAACLLLPKLDGVDIRTFSIDSLDFENISIEEEATANSDHSVSDVPQMNDVKLILTFLADNTADTRVVNQLASHYRTVVAGGYVDNLLQDLSDPATSEENSGFAVAFCGPQLKVASAVLQSSITRAEKIEKKLLPLRSAIEPNHKTVAFMFACIGRGKHFYRGTENVESTAFRKIFPQVPLFGFFGNGEIGFDFVPKDGNDIIKFLDSNPNVNMFHSYTTIFVVISF